MSRCCVASRCAVTRKSRSHWCRPIRRSSTPACCRGWSRVTTRQPMPRLRWRRSHTGLAHASSPTVSCRSTCIPGLRHSSPGTVSRSTSSRSMWARRRTWAFLAPAGSRCRSSRWRRFWRRGTQSWRMRRQAPSRPSAWWAAAPAASKSCSRCSTGCRQSLARAHPASRWSRKRRPSLRNCPRRRAQHWGASSSSAAWCCTLRVARCSSSRGPSSYPMAGGSPSTAWCGPPQPQLSHGWPPLVLPATIAALSAPTIICARRRIRSCSRPAIVRRKQDIHARRRPCLRCARVRRWPPTCAAQRTTFGCAGSSRTAKRLRSSRPGGRHAIGARGALAVAGDWVWRWKDRIDRRFVARYTIPVTMPEASGEASVK